ncbi:MAG: hypothetical protein MNPFHGCM_02320 [Gemmatimonadaceae bacterium]|nr:hypothetical protein [Gemmatimonadaceae bacterium]
MRRWFFVLGSMLLLAGSAQAQDPVKKEKPKSGGANLITQAEIEYANVGTAYDAIKRLRPRMLQRRVGSSTDEGSAGEIVVYLDEAKYGYPDQLNSIVATSIKEIRYYSPSDATTKWGTGHTEGVIQVITKK